MASTHVSAGDAATGVSAQAEARLHGAWLLVARAASAGVSLLALVMWLWGIPYRYAQYATVCVREPCGDQQATPAIAQLLHAAGLSVRMYSLYMGTVEAFYAAVFMAIAALVFWRRSDTVIGLLTTVLFTTFAVSQTDGNALASVVPLWVIPNNLIEPGSFIALAFFLYVFPDGRFAPRWSRYVALAWVPLFIASVLVLAPDTFVALLFAFLVLSLGAQVYRYRRVSSPRQRQQTKWVVFGVIIALSGSITLVLAGMLFHYPNVFGAWGLLIINSLIYALGALIPISIGVSITRYRLWDVDALINKALVYGLLTAVLAALYLGLIAGAQALLRLAIGQQGQSQLVIVLTTLLIAALIQPLRRGLQTQIDRRFYRRKYDAARTLQAFGASLRSQVELHDLSDRLVAVVDETMQPVSISLWLRPGQDSPPAR